MVIYTLQVGKNLKTTLNISVADSTKLGEYSRPKILTQNSNVTTRRINCLYGVRYYLPPDYIDY
nr:MAG TPA: hypothetical protein [Caudoviricetes sp.]